MKDKLIECIKQSFQELRDAHGSLFNCPIEIDCEHDARKLHEICINHKLANYLETNIIPIFSEGNQQLYADIEFNREGINCKNIEIEGQEKTARPDIILHNRKSGEDKFNILVVECKKLPNNNNKIREDRIKLSSFLTDSRYRYMYALQVLYKPNNIQGTLIYIGDEGIEIEEQISC